MTLLRRGLAPAVCFCYIKAFSARFSARFFFFFFSKHLLNLMLQLCVCQVYSIGAL